MTDTKIKLSIPEILMHLGLLTVVFWLFACSLSFFIETENPQNLLILSTEVTLTFYFIPLKHTLKPNKFLFAFTVLFSTLNIFVVFISLFLAIHLIRILHMKNAYLIQYRFFYVFPCSLIYPALLIKNIFILLPQLYLPVLS